MKVLVADDDKVTRVALERHLGKWGHQVVQAQDGLEAWKILNRRDPPKLAILDWMMPEIEGVEICQRLNLDAAAPFIYKILLTVKREKEDIVDALDGGAHDFLSKPVHTSELRSRVAVGVRLVEAEEKLQNYAKEMEKSAVTDYLTGGYNRRYFIRQTEEELKRFSRYGGSFSVLILDIDHFKKINDTYSHLAGDVALKKLTRAVENTLRENDLAARFGGEEFAVFLPETNRKGAFELAERLRNAVQNMSVTFENRTFGFTVSIGLATVKKKDVKIEQVLARADKALYTAKENGRNRTETA
jgi:diguanylate cyclase (GGDEF)-like protein